VGLPLFERYDCLGDVFRQVCDEVREAIRQGLITEALLKPFDIDRLVSIIRSATER
jgi:hypothetical protein